MASACGDTESPVGGGHVRTHRATEAVSSARETPEANVTVVNGSLMTTKEAVPWHVASAHRV